MILEIDEIEGCVSYCRELLSEGPLNDVRGAAAKGALAKLAKGGFAYCELLDIDPTKWSEVAPHKDSSQAAQFVDACYRAGDAFEAFEMYDDQDELLGNVEMSGILLLAAIGTQSMRQDKARAALDRKTEQATRLGTELNATRIKKAKQQSGLKARTTKARERAIAAREAAGTSDLLSAARHGPNRALAALYGFDDPEAFVAEANQHGSGLRKRIERDAKRI